MYCQQCFFFNLIFGLRTSHYHCLIPSGFRQCNTCLTWLILNLLGLREKPGFDLSNRFLHLQLASYYSHT